MGAAEDVLRARRAAEHARQAERLNELRNMALSHIRAEADRTLAWLEQHNWPGGELRNVGEEGETLEERAVWALTQHHLNPIDDRVYFDSLGNLLVQSTTGTLSVVDNETLRRYPPTNIEADARSIAAIRDTLAE